MMFGSARCRHYAMLMPHVDADHAIFAAYAVDAIT